MSERRRVEPRDLLRFALPADPTISPDGRRVAFRVTRMDADKNTYRSQIYLAGPDQPAATLTGGTKDGSPCFSPDGRWLAFVRKGEHSNQIWLLPTGGGEALQLTRIKGGASQPVWSPDSRRIAFLAELGEQGLLPDRKDKDPDDNFEKFNQDIKVIERLTYKWDSRGFLKPERPQVCIIDVIAPGAQPGTFQLAGAAAGSEPMQLTDGAYSHANPSFSPDGALIAFEGARYDDADWRAHCRDIYTVPATGGEVRCLTGERLSAAHPAFSPDGLRIAFFANEPAQHGEGNTNIYVMPAAGGTATCLTAAHDRPFGTPHTALDLARSGPNLLAWSSDGRSLYSTLGSAGAVHLVRVDAETGAVTQLTQGDRVVLGASAAAGYAAFTAADATGPQDVYRINLATGAEERLTNLNRALLDEVHVQQPERFTFRAPGGPDIDGWVIQPVGCEPGERYPAVLEIHGGPAAQYSSAYFFEFQVLAALGFGVIYTNPRGSQGYGYEFCRSIRANWGSLDYDDLMAGTDAALARCGWIDGDRLGVAGGSYGGYMTNWIVSHTDRFKAAVTMRSVTNWISEAGTEDLPLVHIVEEFGPFWADRGAFEHMWRISPLAYAANIHTPLLIEHQEEDHRCPMEQSEQLYHILKWLQREVKFVRYPGESHEMSRAGKPWHRVYRLKTNGDWFSKYLQH